MRSPPCAGDRFLVTFSPARSKSIITSTAGDGTEIYHQVNADMLAFLRS
jgi:hypothetical protein